MSRVAYLFLARLILSANSSRAVKTRSLSRNYNISTNRYGTRQDIVKSNAAAMLLPTMDLITYGLIPAVSTKQVAQSFLRLSTPCSNGTSRPRCAMLSSMTCRPAWTILPSVLLYVTAGGLLEAGLYKS